MSTTQPELPQIFQLSPEERDQLAELLNIGVSHASTTLSQLLNHRIAINVPKVVIKNASNANDFVASTSELTLAVLVRISGGVDGYVFLTFPKNTAIHLLSSLSGKVIGDLRALDQYDRSIFQEIGNVVTGGMLQALSKFLHLHLMHSVPDVVIDMGNAMFNSLSASMIARHEEFLALDVAMCVDAPDTMVEYDESEHMVGRMFLLIGPTVAGRILALTSSMENKSSR
jgi:chemotaxis protein CheC